MTKPGPITALAATLLLTGSIANASVEAPAAKGERLQDAPLPQASAPIDLLILMMGSGDDIENRPGNPPPPPPSAPSGVTLNP